MGIRSSWVIISLLSLSFGELCCSEDSREDLSDDMGLLKMGSFLNKVRLLISQPTVSDGSSRADGITNPVYEELPPHCRMLLDRFAQSVSNFTSCMVINARPVTICRECISSLLSMRVTYKEILDDKKNNCQHQLLNRDRLMIVQSTIERLENVWSNGRCDNCFFIQQINGTNNYTLCNDTLQFYEKWYDVAVCLNNTNDKIMIDAEKNESIVCEVCQPVYLELNRYYESLNTKYSNLLCMDVMDLMNITRHQWTNTYHCVQFNFNGLPVVILSSIMALIPVIFYGGNRIFSHVRDTRLLQQKRLSFVHSSFNSSNALQREHFNSARS